MISKDNERAKKDECVIICHSTTTTTSDEQQQSHYYSTLQVKTENVGNIKSRWRWSLGVGKIGVSRRVLQREGRNSLPPTTYDDKQ